jgi:TetR/AcrR family transcriptional regulator
MKKASLRLRVEESGKPTAVPAKTSRHPAFDRNDQIEKRRRAMLQTAIRSFNRNGFHSTSMEAIAAELGLTKGTLYHYYESKTDLLYECLLQALEDGRAMAEKAGQGGGSGVEKLERFLRLQFSTLAGSNGSSWLMADISALPPQQRAEVRRQSRLVDAMLQEFIADGIADGSIEPTEPRIAEFFIMGALNWVPRWYSPEGSMTSDELASIFIAIVLTGLKSKGAARKAKRIA